MAAKVRFQMILRTNKINPKMISAIPATLLIRERTFSFIRFLITFASNTLRLSVIMIVTRIVPVKRIVSTRFSWRLATKVVKVLNQKNKGEWIDRIDHKPFQPVAKNPAFPDWFLVKINNWLFRKSYKTHS